MRNRGCAGEKEKCMETGHGLGLEDETDVELKKDKEMKIRRRLDGWMAGCVMANQKRQMERCRDRYIAGRLNVQHMARVRDRK